MMRLDLRCNGEEKKLTDIIYCEKVDLPLIPSHLIKSLDVIETYENLHPYPDNPVYASRVVNPDLEEWIQSLFDHPVSVRYQIIKGILPVHVDHTPTDFKLNYIVADGGDNVYTRWWDDAKNPTTIVQERHLDENTWYKLNVRLPHNVTEPESTRISITVLEM